MGVSLTIVLTIASVLLATALGILIALRVLRRRRDEELLVHATPALVVPIAPISVATQRPHLAHHVTALRSSPRSVSVVPPEVPFEDHTFDEDEVMLITDGSAATDTTLTVIPRPEPPLSDGAGQVYEAETVGYYEQRSDEGTLEFLPGRLEVIGGTDQGQEIHFVRPPDGDVPMVTFGRSEGPPHRHVQLLDRTVSRLHARMTFDHDRWSLSNLSRTNPVLVNGVPLHSDAPPVTLTDSDRIEMGAVVFVFRAR